MQGDPYGLGGSGGISIRSKQAMLDAIEYELAGVPQGKKAEKVYVFTLANMLCSIKDEHAH